MTIRPRTVSVMGMPATLDGAARRQFFRDLDNAIEVERPAIVLDCALAGDMDGAEVYLLLCCLEKAMKRNGDVRLAGVSSSAMETLERLGADRLFCIFSTVSEAAESYRRRAPAIVANAADGNAAARQPA